jgi:hypothetical protein
MPEDAKAGKDFTETLSDLEHTLTRLGQVLVTKFEPSMAALIKQATELAGQPWIKDEVEAKLREFVTFLEGVGSAVKTVVIAVGGWENATKAVFALWALREVAPILTAIASITTATLGLGSAASGVALTFGGLPALIAGTALALGGAIWDDERIKKYNLEHPDSPIETWFQMFSRMGKGVGNFLGQHFGGATDERQASVRDQLSQRLGISQAAASGIVSNLNAESGIAGINEINPKSGQGGFGWAQWTNTQGSPRRDAFEAYAARMGLSPASDEANMGYLVEELTNKYPQVLAQLRRGDISAREAADIVARGYIVPPSDKIAGHVAGAEGINQLPSPPHYSPIMGDPTPKHPPAYSQGLSNLWGTAPKISFDPALSNLMRTPTAAATTANDNSRKVSNNSETTIGAVHVHTAATDAEGVARGVGAALRKYAYVNQANWGLT